MSLNVGALMELAKESLMMLMYFKRNTELRETEMSFNAVVTKSKSFPEFDCFLSKLNISITVILSLSSDIFVPCLMYYF